MIFRSILSNASFQRSNSGSSRSNLYVLAPLEWSSSGDFGYKTGGALGAGGGQRSEDLMWFIVSTGNTLNTIAIC
jgi:hypothetical protein